MSAHPDPLNTLRELRRKIDECEAMLARLSGSRDALLREVKASKTFRTDVVLEAASVSRSHYWRVTK